MSKELVISSNRHETKVALIEDDLLCEVYFQRANEYSLAGSIHKGRVTRVLPGMQSAFVDLGLERDTFLYVSDFLEEHEDFDKITGDERPVRESRERDGRDREPRDRDSRDRERRPPQGPPPSVQSFVAPALESGDAAVEASTVPAAVPSSESRPDDRGPDRGGDRRGRRSRRRRNDGRGFPDSKYAPTGAEHRPSGPRPVSEPAPEAIEPVETAASEAIEEIVPLILPGESLKKYRGAPAVKAPVAVEPETV
jgi:Ribonuclease G/E